MRLAVLPFLALGLSAAAVPAQAGEPCTRIDHLPYVIGAPGRYCVDHPLVTRAADQRAISVEADDVQLDLFGGLRYVGNQRGNLSVGVYAANRKHLRVQNGSLEGFRFGILVADAAARSEGHVVDSVVVRGSRAVGIAVTGYGTLIRNSWVRKTGTREPFAIGISNSGGGAVIVDNRVDDTVAGIPGGYAAAIDLTHGTDHVVAGNQVLGVSGGSDNYGIRCGLRFAPRNVILGAQIPATDCTSTTQGPEPYPYPDPSPYPYPTPNPYPSPSSMPYPYPYPYPYPFGHSHLPLGTGAEGAGAVAAAAALAALVKRLV